MPPSVTVITPVHNCMPYLEDTLASVYHQSLDRSEIEMIVVDDGSTDDGPACLRAWSERWPELRVITQAASGGPGGPRNVGIGLARGEYVFFLDGDDCLGPRALERLLAMARRNDSDIVLAKLVGIGRFVPTEMFTRDVDRAELTSGPYYTLMPVKLFRRSLIIDHGITFPEHVRISEDQLFVARAYIEASVISIVGSYDCYYATTRREGTNTSMEGLEYRTKVAQADEVVQMVCRHVGPGKTRNHMIARHLRIEVLRRFGPRFLDLSPAEREATLEVAGPFVDEWAAPEVLAELPVPTRLRAVGVRRRDTERLLEIARWDAAGGQAAAIRDGDRWYQAAPYFRDPAASFPDWAYEMGGSPKLVTHLDRLTWDSGRLFVEGHGFLRGLDSRETSLRVSARHRASGTVREAHVESVPSPHVNALAGHGVADYTRAGFRAELDFSTSDDGAPAPRGLWDVVVRARWDDFEAERRLGASRAGDIGAAPVKARISRAGKAVPAWTRFGPRGHLTVQVGRRGPAEKGSGEPPAAARRGGRRLGKRRLLPGSRGR